MNALTPTTALATAEHTARSKRTCARLAELAMQMAETLAAKTIAEQAAAPPPNAAADPNAAQARKQPDPTLQFNRLARIVLDCIALESFLDGNAPPGRATHKPASPQPAAHPRPQPPAPRLSIADNPEFIALRAKLDKAIASDPAVGRRAATASPATSAYVFSHQTTAQGGTLAPPARAAAGGSVPR